MGLDCYYIECYKAKSSGVCEICGRKEKRELSVDHCHKKIKFRGLLCSRCNLGIGIFEDDPKLLVKVIEYLNRGPLSACK